MADQKEEGNRTPLKDFTNVIIFNTPKSIKGLSLSPQSGGGEKVKPEAILGETFTHPVEEDQQSTNSAASSPSKSHTDVDTTDYESADEGNVSLNPLSITTLADYLDSVHIGTPKKVSPLVGTFPFSPAEKDLYISSPKSADNSSRTLELSTTTLGDEDLESSRAINANITLINTDTNALSCDITEESINNDSEPKSSSCECNQELNEITKETNCSKPKEVLAVDSTPQISTNNVIYDNSDLKANTNFNREIINNSVEPSVYPLVVEKKLLNNTVSLKQEHNVIANENLTNDNNTQLGEINCDKNFLSEIVESQPSEELSATSVELKAPTVHHISQNSDRTVSETSVQCFQRSDESFGEIYLSLNISESDFTSWENETIRAVAESDLKSFERETFQAVEESNIKPIENKAITAEAESDIKPTENKTISAVVKSDIKPIETKTTSAVAQLDIRSIEDKTISAVVGSDIQPIENKTVSAAAESDIKLTENKTISAKAESDIKPIENKTISAVVETDIKPIENKTIITAAEADIKQTKNKTISVKVASDIKPIETKTTSAVVGSDIQPIENKTVSAAAESDIKLTENKTVTAHAESDIKPTENKTIITAAEADIKQTENKTISVEVASDIKPIETKTTSAVAGLDIRLIEDKTTSAVVGSDIQPIENKTVSAVVESDIKSIENKTIVAAAEVDIKQTENKTISVEVGSDIKPIETKTTSAVAGLDIRSIEDKTTSAVVGSDIQPIENKTVSAVVESDIKSIENKTIVAAAEVDIKQTENKTISVEVGSDIKPIETKTTSAVAGLDIRLIEDKTTSAVVGSDIQPIENKTISAVVESDIKPIENKTIITAAEADIKQTENKTISVEVGSDIKPIETKTTSAVAGLDIRLIEDKTTSAVVGSDIQPIENKAVGAAAESDIKLTENKTISAAVESDIKQTENKTLTAEAESDIKPTENKTISAVVGSDIKSVETKTTSAVSEVRESGILQVIDTSTTGKLLNQDIPKLEDSVVDNLTNSTTDTDLLEETIVPCRVKADSIHEKNPLVNEIIKRDIVSFTNSNTDLDICPNNLSCVSSASDCNVTILIKPLTINQADKGAFTISEKNISKSNTEQNLHQIEECEEKLSLKQALEDAEILKPLLYSKIPKQEQNIVNLPQEFTCSHTVDTTDLFKSELTSSTTSSVVREDSLEPASQSRRSSYREDSLERTPNTGIFSKPPYNIMDRSYNGLQELYETCSKQERELGCTDVVEPALFNLSIATEAKRLADEINKMDLSSEYLDDVKPPQCMMQSSLPAEINNSEAGPITADEDFKKSDYFQNATTVFNLEYLSRSHSQRTLKPSNLTRNSLFLKFDPLVGKLVEADEQFNDSAMSDKPNNKPMEPSEVTINNSLVQFEPPVLPEKQLNLLSLLEEPPNERPFELSEIMDEHCLVKLNPNVLKPDSGNKNLSKNVPTDEPLTKTWTPPKDAAGNATLVPITPLSSKNQPSTNSTPNSTKSQGSTPTLRQEFLSKEISKLQELMLQQEAAHQELLLEKTDEVEKLRKRLSELEMREPKHDLEKRLKELQAENARLQKELSESNASNKQLIIVMEEYEKTISQLVTNKEEMKNEHEKIKDEIAQERDTAVSHLNNMEVAFNDVHAKYERVKSIVETLHSNEKLLKDSLEEHVKTIERQKANYNKLKHHASEKLQAANQEIANLVSSHQMETAKMNAVAKKAELKIKSLEEALEQKKNEVRELTQICDELIGKVTIK